MLIRRALARPAILVALAAGLLGSAVVVEPVAGARPVAVHKTWPTTVREYLPGRAVTPNTDILSRSGYAAWMIDEYLAMATPLPHLGAAFMAAERATGINARTLLAHAMLESGFGQSDIARFKHNLFGLKAYDRAPFRYASSYPSYAAGIAAVAATIKKTYLSPTGRWYVGFTTLQAMNIAYASDPRWADKISVLANQIDAAIVTLRERGLRFGAIDLGAPPVVGRRISIRIPWTTRGGAAIPPALRFAVRWTPIAASEAGADPTFAAPAWVAAARTSTDEGSLALAATAPAAPGLWRLEVRALDSDGSSLPPGDDAPIPALTVRVGANVEAALDVSLDGAGLLVASVHSVGIAPVGTGTVAAPVASPAVPAPGDVAAGTGEGQDATTTAPSGVVAAGTAGPTRLETWILPLDPDRDAVRLAVTPIPGALAPGGSFSVFLQPPALHDRPVLVVVRLAGDPAVTGHSVPVVALLSPTPTSGSSLATLSVADARTTARLATLLRTPAATAGRALGVEAAVDPNALVVRIGAPGAAALLATASAADTALPAAPDPNRAEVLLRTLGVDPGTEAGPTAARLVADQGDLATAAAGGKAVTVEALRLAPGVRLVVAGLLAHGAAYADPATLVLAWIPVTGAADATDRPE